MNLIDKLPYFYDNGITRPIIDAEQEERDILFQEIADTLAQCFVSTATWGLDYWEDLLLIPHDYSKANEERRSVIYTKMRSTRTTTAEVIRQLAMGFFEVEDVTVTEYNSEYYFDIELQNAYSKEAIIELNTDLVDDALVGYAEIGVETIIVNFTDIENLIDTYKPAHLNYTFTITFKGNVQINTNQRIAYSTLPICNVTRVGTWWKMYADGSNNNGEIIQAQSYNGYSHLPICGVYTNTIKQRKGYLNYGVVGSAIVGQSTVGGE